MTLERVDVSGRMALETPEAGYRFAATVNGFTLHLDSGPDAQAPSPVQALLVALAGCQSMDVIHVLRKKRMVPTSYVVEFRGQRATEHPRRFTAVEIVHRLRGPGLKREAVAEAVHLSEAKYCSVHHSLRPDLFVHAVVELEGD